MLKKKLKAISDFREPRVAPLNLKKQRKYLFAKEPAIAKKMGLKNMAVK
jgi:hypothetical protein